MANDEAADIWSAAQRPARWVAWAAVVAVVLSVLGASVMVVGDFRPSESIWVVAWVSCLVLLGGNNSRLALAPLRVLILATVVLLGLSVSFFITDLSPAGDGPGPGFIALTGAPPMIVPLVLLATSVATERLARRFATQPDRPALAAEAEPPALHQQPTWQPDQASGAVWSRASGAASGEAAARWGEPGRPRRGWSSAAEAEQVADAPSAQPAEQAVEADPDVPPGASTPRPRPDWGI